MRYRSTSLVVSLFSLSLSALSCGSSTTPPPASSCTSTGTTACDKLTSYSCTGTGAGLSFATDIYPILSDTGVGGTTSSCSTALICHGTPPIAIDTAGTMTLSFAASPAMVKAALLANSVNAPTMKRVVPGNVGASFMAYKISGAASLACVNSMCVAGASVGGSMPCGDPMPSPGVGFLSDAQRTKILDWIGEGAAD